jgi:hypothetical protein
VCVQKWWAGGFIEPVGSIIIIQSLSHGWIIQLTQL